MTTTVLGEPTEVAPLTALRAPANIKAARAAIIVCFTVVTTSRIERFLRFSFSLEWLNLVPSEASGLILSEL